MANTSASKAEYGSIPTSEQRHRSVEASEAEEGPFPVPLKSMLLAEVFGTAVLVQVGTACNAAALYTSSMSNNSVAVGWAFALTLGIYVSAARSGGHLNPAVSFAFCLVRPADFPFRKLLPYWAAQLLGAVIAGAMNLFLFHHSINSYEEEHEIVRGQAASIESAAAFGDYYSIHPDWVKNGVHAFFIEAFGTAVLTFVIFAVTHMQNPVPGAAVPPIVGITLGAIVTFLGPLTGAGVNPARDLGPRLVTLFARWGPVAFTDVWPYILGPIFGGPIGAFFADHVLML